MRQSPAEFSRFEAVAAVAAVALAATDGDRHTSGDLAAPNC